MLTRGVILQIQQSLPAPPPRTLDHVIRHANDQWLESDQNTASTIQYHTLEKVRRSMTSAIASKMSKPAAPWDITSCGPLA